MKQKYIIFWSLLPVIILITNLYVYREYKTIKSLYFGKADLLQQRSSNSYKPNKVMIGSSIANEIVKKYPKNFYSYGIPSCGYVFGMRYLLTRYALDNIHSADIYFMAINEHWGDGIFFQYFFLTQPPNGGVISCKKIFDNLQQRYPLPEYTMVNDFDFFSSVSNGQRARYQKRISATFPLKYFNTIFRVKNTTLKNNKTEQQDMKIHPLADKYLRKSIDVLLENNKKVVIIRLPQGDKTIKTQGKKVAILKDYMLQLQKDYGDKIYSLDYLYKFTDKSIKDFEIHLRQRHKSYLDILQNDIQEDLTRLLDNSNTK